MAAVHGVRLALLLLTTWLGVVVSKVKLVNQGYEGVTIAINPDIKENRNILWRLEEFLTATSATLFQATRHQLYFREFLIVIPEEWKPRQRYENALDVDLDRAQIIIDRSNPAYGDAPYVKQYAECGSPGLYIHLTPGYLLDDAVVQKWGKPDKTIVHEWAHLRWGLFDEYPIDAQDDAFYRYAGLWQPTRCSTEVEGSILNEYTSRPCSFDFFTGKPEKNCRFFPRMGSNKAAASLMFMQYLNSIVEFCDHPLTAPKPLRHNYLAPNRHNRLCMYKSAWEVMRKHADFKNVKHPLPVNTDTRPRFRYVQAHPRKRVLVLDTSGSMTGTSLAVMKQAASNYILSCIESGSKMGIVQFSTNASALADLQEIRTENDRFHLIDSLPMKADGKTSIGAGLSKGVEVLTAHGEAPGGSIILITDGKENEGPYLKDLRPALMKRGIVVHALAYGQKADTGIASLSTDTGGKTFFYSGRPNSTALIDGLAATVTQETSIIPKSSVPQSILTDARVVTKDSPFTGSFYIDTTVGKETSLTFSYSRDVTVKVQGPSSEYTARSHPASFRDDKGSHVLKVMLPGDADAGMWGFHVSTKFPKSHVTVSVQSKTRQKGAEVLQVTSWIPQQGDLDYNPKQKLSVYAEVLRGKAPVLNAQVLANVERPDGEPIELTLVDNGIGADIIKGDGVYAANIMPKDMKGDGRYNVKVKVIGKEGEVKVVVGGAGRSSGALEKKAADGLINTETGSIESFQRVSAAGEFRLQGFHTAEKAIKQGIPPKDEMPPSRITDLMVTYFDFDKVEATLQWTAVGDDMERGRASKHVINIAHDYEKLLFYRNKTSFLQPSHLINGSSLYHPQTAGVTELVTLRLQPHWISNNRTVFLSVVAVDEAGNQGDTSNLVSLSPAQDTAVPRVAVETISLHTYLAVCLPFAVVMFGVVVAGLGCLVVRARKMKSKNIEQIQKQHLHSAASMTSLDFSNMNYMFEGEYRKRPQENPDDIDTWSRDGI